MKQQQTSSNKWYDRRDGALGLCILSLGLAYLAGSRAIDTGSLQQYTLTFVLIAIALNRGARALGHFVAGVRHG